MTQASDPIEFHRRSRGKITINSKTPLDAENLSIVYTPGVGAVSTRIAEQPDEVRELTGKQNTVAIVTDGTAVLGLGDIGPEAALPVMEGKAAIFSEFASINAVPICLATTDTDAIVQTVRYLAPGFGGVNLEDISAPRCFEIERRLTADLDIPVFHDDQHGTAIIVLAALLNALKITGKQLKDLRVVINGAGAAGVAIGKIILRAGAANLIMCDSKGIIYSGRAESMNPAKEEMAGLTNRDNKKGSLADALAGADVFIGVSSANVVSTDMVKSMNKDPIVFALANPVPEIDPDLAKKAGARVVGTGRSDYPNQINNVLAFPGVFRGALDVRAADINEEMKLAAAYALAGVVAKEELNGDYIIPKPFDPRVAPAVARAVARAAMDSGVARIKADPEEIAQRTKEMLEKIFS